MQGLIFKYDSIGTNAIRIAAIMGRVEVGHVYLYFIGNDLHERRYAYMEDLGVAEDMQDRGVGKILVHKFLEKAREFGCYKVVCTSRYARTHVHSLYEGQGMENSGFAFRLDID